MTTASRPRVAPGSARDVGPVNLVVSRIGARRIGARDMHLFSTLGRTKRLFLAWLAWSASLMPFGSLRRSESETVILRVAGLRESAYELGHHRRLGARAGLSAEQVELAIAGEGWDARSRALLAAASELVGTREITEATWAELERHFDQRHLVEIVLLITQYDGLATTIETLGIQPEA